MIARVTRAFRSCPLITALTTGILFGPLPNGWTADAPPQIVVSPSQSGRVVAPGLFGAIINWTKACEGAANPTTGITYQSFVDAVRQIGITSIRYGGGTISATCFEWDRAIGPMAQRTTNRARDGAPGQPSVFGPDEWGNMLDRTGARGHLGLNTARQSVQSNVNFVAYMTAPLSASPSTDPNEPSYWAALRARNGHPAPYPIDFVDIGNEEENINLNWRSGTPVSVANVFDASSDVRASLYAFGGTTAFTKQAAVGFSDLSTAAGISTGVAGQVFYASYPPVAAGSDIVYVDDVAWTRVADFSTVAPTAQVYRIENATGKITFGDGTRGRVPPANSKVTVTYQCTHAGYVDFYDKIKSVNPAMPVVANHSDIGFLEAMGTKYSYDALANHDVLSFGYPLTTTLPLREFMLRELLTPDAQVADEFPLQHQIRKISGKNIPLVLTAYGHGQGNVPTGFSDSHLWLIDGLVQVKQLIAYQNMGMTVAHRFLLNDTPFNPDTDDAPSARRFNASIISNGSDDKFVITPNGYGIQLVSKLAGKTQVASDVAGNPAIPLLNGQALPTFTTMAARDDAGNLHIIVVNGNLDSDVTAQVVTSGYTHDATATFSTLNGPSAQSSNTLTQTNVVTITDKTVNVGTGNFSYTFPAHSVTRILLTNVTALPVTIFTQPTAQTQPAGGSATFTVAAAGAGTLSYQWLKNGAAMVAATGSALTLSNLRPADAASYRVVVTNGTGASATSSVANLTLGSASTRISNLSILGYSGSNAQMLTVGFAVGGTESKSTLVRAIAPTLADFGVTGTMQLPLLTLFSGATISALSSTWGNTDALNASFARVGAFSLAPDAADSALLRSLAPGAYAIQAADQARNGTNDPSGVVLLEVYDADSSLNPPSSFVNISGRALVNTANTLSLGFSVSGSQTLSVLVRAVGPTLGQFGVGGALARPQLAIYNSNGALVSTNASWGGAATLSAAFTQSGAFPLPTASADAAILLNFPPGQYTAQVTGLAGSTGIALVELYSLGAK